MSAAAGIFDVALAVAVLVVAAVAVLVPRRAAAVAGFLVFGILLALLWARLDSPDVALAEAALGGGVAGALLVDALATPAPRRAPRPSWWLVGAGVLAGVVSFTALAAVVRTVRTVPTGTGPVPDLVTQAIPDSGVEHPITAVLLNFRSYDTLLEIAVLVVAVLAASGVARGAEPALGPPSPVLHVLVVLLLPALALLAAWLLVAGTTRPGGAFQAGAVLGAGLVVAHLAGVRGAVPGGPAGATWVVGGLTLFVALAAATAAVGDGWLVLGPTWAGTAILGLETVLALSVGAGLARIFVLNRVDAPGEDVAA
ncbi:hydrogenase subunit MbhD domain-containing protein [Nocardioides sp.]|uniref:hydrogenase subunit MbhD domain-containing protein n=1 Tax=Nocardioides sp. TaxID=35761 RepID=UPI0027362AEA|nr:hydrogenase subunit MbhD domain-containing protein [Nocardioides sp.]MDP3890328.1 DUF4040 domain-containing protein [Nocardioides sp.]